MRAFLALVLEGDALAAAARWLAALRAGPAARDLRFVRPEGLHVTLRFLGEIEEAAVPALAEHVAAELAAQAPFAVHVAAPHAFPSPRRPRVVALGLEPAEPLAELAAAVERGAVRAGFAPEPRPFRGHVTLARVRDGRRPDLAAALDAAAAEVGVAAPANQAGVAALGAQRAHEVVLFESRTGAGGSVYTPRGRTSLGGPASRDHTG